MIKMINVFYNLKRLPFQKEISHQDIFRADSANELLRRLEHMKQQRGIMLITGMPGTGKTLHIRAFVEGLNQNLYKPFYIPLSTVNTLQFYRQLSQYLSGEDLWRKSDLFQAIQTSIRDYVSNNKKVPVIIFDEAHLMKNENFYELQLITNFSMDSLDPCLFIIAAQPHLRDRLLRPIHQSFNQRITLKFHLPALTKEETSAYITHHLSLSGVKQPLFNENALAAIHQNSAGIPRIINSLAIKTMNIGAFEKKEVLTEEEVYGASQEL